jgi:hypothetical protein
VLGLIGSLASQHSLSQALFRRIDDRRARPLDEVVRNESVPAALAGDFDAIADA